MITCVNCKIQYDENRRFCPRCGMINKSPQTTPIQQAPTVPQPPPSSPYSASPPIQPPSAQQAPYQYPVPSQQPQQLPSQPELPPKKKRKGGFVAVIIVICIVIMGIAVGALMIFSNQGSQQESSPDKQALLEQQISLGEKYLLEENYEEAIVAFKTAIDIEPNNPELYIKLADTYIAAGRSKEALEALEDGYEKTGDENIKKKIEEVKIEIQFEDLMTEGQNEYNNKNYETAINKFKEAISLKPKEVQPYLSAADAYIANKDTGGAKEILKEGYQQTKSDEIKNKLDNLPSYQKAYWNVIQKLIEENGEGKVIEDEQHEGQYRATGVFFVRLFNNDDDNEEELFCIYFGENNAGYSEVYDFDGEKAQSVYKDNIIRYDGSSGNYIIEKHIFENGQFEVYLDNNTYGNLSSVLNETNGIINALKEGKSKPDESVPTEQSIPPEESSQPEESSRTEESSQTAVITNTEAHKVYQEVLDQDEIKWSSDSDRSYSSSDYSFKLIDLNNDGVDELLLTCNPASHAEGYMKIGMISDGEFKLVAYGEAVRSYYPKSGVVICHYSNMGQSSNVYSVLKDNELLPFAETITDYDDPYAASNCQKIESTSPWSASDITPEEFEDLLNQYLTEDDSKIEIEYNDFYENTEENRNENL